jgi:hypothetical protein
MMKPKYKIGMLVEYSTPKNIPLDDLRSTFNYGGVSSVRNTQSKEGEIEGETEVLSLAGKGVIHGIMICINSHSSQISYEVEDGGYTQGTIPASGFYGLSLIKESYISRAWAEIKKSKPKRREPKKRNRIESIIENLPASEQVQGEATGG